MVFSRFSRYTISNKRQKGAFMTWRKYFIFVLSGLFLFGGFAPLDAQLVKQGLKQVPQALGKNAGKTAVNPWVNFKGKIPAAVPAEKGKVGFKTKIARKYPGAVLSFEKNIRQKTQQQALRRVAELRQSGNKGWVKTMPQALTTPHLTVLTLDGYAGDVPASAPVPTNKIYLYRGMGLDENALRNVLKNGLRVQDAGKEANAIGVQMRLLSLGTMPATEDMIRQTDIKQTYLTPRANETLHFAYMHSFADGKIPVVVTVRNWRKTNDHHVVAEDIPASDFVEVSALIKGPEGTPIWSRVQLAPDGESFIFTPYIPRAEK